MHTHSFGSNDDTTTHIPIYNTLRSVRLIRFVNLVRSIWFTHSCTITPVITLQQKCEDNEWKKKLNIYQERMRIKRLSNRQKAFHDNFQAHTTTKLTDSILFSPFLFFCFGREWLLMPCGCVFGKRSEAFVCDTGWFRPANKLNGGKSCVNLIEP